MPSLAFYCASNKHDRCPLRSNRCTCGCHSEKEREELAMLESVECPECGRMLRKGPGEASHMRAMHPETLRQTRGVPSSTTHDAAQKPDDDGLIWEEPPASARGLAGQLQPLVIKLKRRPGAWARVREYDGRTSANTQVKKARVLFPDCEFQAGIHGKGSALWGRSFEDS